MTTETAIDSRRSLATRSALAISLAAIAAFHLAYEFSPLAFLMGGFCLCMVALAHVRSARMAFYLGLAIGMAIYAPQLWFFAGIFKAAAIALWLVLAIFVALYLLIAQACVRCLPRGVALLALPMLWTGLEYFRSELHYLRFSWVNQGFAFSNSPHLLWPGVYGVGFCLMLLAAMVYLLRPKPRLIAGAAMLLMLAIAVRKPSPTLVRTVGREKPFIVGMQLEHPSERIVLQALDAALEEFPLADLFLLSEYTFGTPPPARVLEWCRAHEKYLIVGGVQPVGESGAYHNTAFVVGPDGTIVFSQGKSVPIQFFTDGLPAEAQSLWPSPWGKIGICICYDLSYSRVTDRLVQQGAAALIVPTMDLHSWGEREHALHARVGPSRAAEYGVPVVRVCSSGISQIIGADGRVTASASFPGQGESIAGALAIGNAGRLPIDRWLAPACTALVPALALLCLIERRRQRRPGSAPRIE